LYEDVQLALRNEVPIASRRWHKQPNVIFLKPLIEQAKKEAEDTSSSDALSGAKAWHWLRALVLQAPQAALAQGQMDSHHHGFSARGEHEESSTVVDARGVTGGDRTVLLEGRLHLGQGFHGRATLDVFIGVEDHFALAGLLFCRHKNY
jgi:hypothetical protein